MGYNKKFSDLYKEIEDLTENPDEYAKLIGVMFEEAKRDLDIYNFMKYIYMEIEMDYRNLA